jgi:hypothetical protein
MHKQVRNHLTMQEHIHDWCLDRVRSARAMAEASPNDPVLALALAARQEELREAKDALKSCQQR